MDYYNMLKHYKEDMSGDVLVEDAILSLEQQFSYMNADDLINRSRTYAIAYLALKEISDSKKVHYGHWVLAGIPPHCSMCGCEAKRVDGGYVIENCCPNCGAIMNRNSLFPGTDEDR